MKHFLSLKNLFLTIAIIYLLNIGLYSEKIRKETSLGFAHFQLPKNWKLKTPKATSDLPVFIHPSSVQLYLDTFGRDLRNLDDSGKYFLKEYSGKMVSKGKTSFGLDYQLIHIPTKIFTSEKPVYVFLFQTYESTGLGDELDPTLVNGLVFEANSEILEQEKESILKIIQTVRVEPKQIDWKKISIGEKDFSMEIPKHWSSNPSFWKYNGVILTHPNGFATAEVVVDWKRSYKPIPITDLEKLIQTGEYNFVTFGSKKYEIQKTKKLKNKKQMEFTLLEGNCIVYEDFTYPIYFLLFPINTEKKGLIVFTGFNGTKLDLEHILNSITISPK